MTDRELISIIFDNCIIVLDERNYINFTSKEELCNSICKFKSNYKVTYLRTPYNNITALFLNKKHKHIRGTNASITFLMNDPEGFNHYAYNEYYIIGVSFAMELIRIFNENKNDNKSISRILNIIEKENNTYRNKNGR